MSLQIPAQQGYFRKSVQECPALFAFFVPNRRSKGTLLTRFAPQLISGPK